MTLHFAARQVLPTKNPTEDDWTEEGIIPAASENEAAEKFCSMYVLDGDPPYRVEVRAEHRRETSTWQVARVMEPVFRASEVR